MAGPLDVAAHLRPGRTRHTACQDAFGRPSPSPGGPRPPCDDVGLPEDADAATEALTASSTSAGSSGGAQLSSSTESAATPPAPATPGPASLASAPGADCRAAGDVTSLGVDVEVGHDFVPWDESEATVTLGASGMSSGSVLLVCADLVGAAAEAGAVAADLGSGGSSAPGGDPAAAARGCNGSSRAGGGDMGWLATLGARYEEPPSFATLAAGQTAAAGSATLRKQAPAPLPTPPLDTQPPPCPFRCSRRGPPLVEVGPAGSPVFGCREVRFDDAAASPTFGRSLEPQHDAPPEAPDVVLEEAGRSSRSRATTPRQAAADQAADHLRHNIFASLRMPPASGPAPPASAAFASKASAASKAGRGGTVLGSFAQSASHRALDQMTVAPGTQLEYYSASHGRWVPTVVRALNPETGAVCVDAKPGQEIAPAEQRDRLRPRTRPTEVQLEWVRAVLREGEPRIQAEAAGFYGRAQGQRGVKPAPTAFMALPRARPVGQEAAAGAPQGPPAALSPEDLVGVAEELDAALGVSFSMWFLQRDARATDGYTFTADGFTRAFSDLLWQVECESCQVLLTKPRLRREDPSEVYSFEQTLASGVYGPVRFAKHKETGVTHAVKVLRRNGLTPGSREEREQLEHELCHLRRLDHPNIVKLYENFENAEGIFLVMDYCSGGQLQAMLTECRTAGRALPESFTADVVRQVLSAVAHMHARRVIHLDITANNVMLMPSSDSPPGRDHASWFSRYTLAQVQHKPHVMVIDFGVAQIFRPGCPPTRSSTPVSIGSTLAPEVWRGEITPKADVFSCGALLFLMLCLEQPFECPRDYVLAVNYWHQKPRPPWKKVKRCSRESQELCRKMLHIDRHARPQAHECYQQSAFLRDSDPAAAASVEAGTRMALRLLRQLAEVPTRSWLHRSVALSIARTLPANQLATVKRLFHTLDVAGSGRLDKARVAEALSLAGTAEAAARRAADAMDLGREGRVAWTEFVAACIDLTEPRYDEHLRRLFDAADADSDGLLSQDDLAGMFATDRLCTDVARDVFLEMTGRDEPGARVDWATFRQHFLAGPRAVEGVSATSCAAMDVASAMQEGLENLAGQAQVIFDRVRDTLWPAPPPGRDGSPPGPPAAVGGASGRSRSVGQPPKAQEQAEADEESKLKQLESMGFADRERCIRALRKHRGDLRRALLEELVPPHSGAAGLGKAGGEAGVQWWRSWMP